MSTFTSPLGIRARREALGLTQKDAARCIGLMSDPPKPLQQVVWSRWETGTTTPRNWPQIDGFLTNLEDEAAELVDAQFERGRDQSAVENHPVVELATYTDDAAFWAAYPDAARIELPATFHRSATARAAVALRLEHDIDAAITAG